MEREACVCDHGFERSDLCAEIIIIIIIKIKIRMPVWGFKVLLRGFGYPGEFFTSSPISLVFVERS